MNPNQHGGAGYLGLHVLEHVALEKERDLELVKPMTVRVLMGVLVNLSKRKHAIMVYVRLGLIGPAGMIAVPIAEVELNPELVNARTETKMIVQDHQLKSSNVTENPVILMGCSIGKTTLEVVGVGDGLTKIVFPLVKQYTIDVPHIACRSMDVLLPGLFILNSWTILNCSAG